MTINPDEPSSKDFEFAKLRLECWKAIAGWGVRNPDAKDPIDKLIVLWDWEERKDRADDLLKWILSSFPEVEEKEEGVKE